MLGASVLLASPAAAAAAAAGMGRVLLSPPPSAPPAVAAAGELPTAADYVVVGGGTAGCVVAARLCAALPAASVVLVERGPPRSEATELKVRAMGGLHAAWDDPTLTEAWPSAPVPGLPFRRVTLLTGATLGGTSATNAGQWTVPAGAWASTWGVEGLDDAAAARPERDGGGGAAAGGARPGGGAPREVVLTAGPYGTPTLLQRSGVGPPPPLAAAGVRQRVDLPIGERVISRAVGILVALYTGVPRHPSGVKGAALQPAAVAAWRAGRGGVTGTGRTSTNGRLQGGAAMQEATFAAPDGLAQRAPVLVSACLPPPAGAGRLSLPAGGASAGDPPVAALPLMGSAAEVATTVGCLQQLRGVARRLNPRFRLVDVAPPPGVPVTPCYVRTTARSAFHTVGGPAMGRVLTPTLGVRGVPRPAGGGRVGHTDARLDGGAHGQRVHSEE
ncbi:hypothetical protein I4F81_008935 [Pyropia yezoensis]|uniref:Uncharacterized protein n=1 Tax=Pyropia yezoensis TaxID=2788 RepID=A0ACC3C856_PYRYE|nr:hypothetical protein I4F81_008935 [Neopyropia yezoensis]